MRSRDPGGSVACSRTRASLARRRSREDAGSASGLARSAPRGRALAPFVFSFTPPREVDEDREGSASRGIQSETNLERASRHIEGLRTGKRVRAEERKGKDRAVGRGKCEKSDRFRVSSFGGGPVSALPASRRRKYTSRSSVTLFPRSTVRVWAFSPSWAHSAPAQRSSRPLAPVAMAAAIAHFLKEREEYRELTEFQLSLIHI